MNEETLVEDLVRAGLSADLVGRVARVLVLLGKARNSAEVTEDRRAKDRERKKKKPSKDSELPKANDVGNLRGIPGKSAELRQAHCNLLTKSSSLSISDSSLGRTASEEEYAGGRGRKRGTRVPPNWQPTERDVAYAHQRGVTGKRLQDEIEGFVDYWIAVPGQRGCKLDWSATWRGRMRHITAGVNGHGKSRQGSLTDLCTELADEARELERKAGIHGSSELERRD